MSYVVLRDGQRVEVHEIETLEVALDALECLDEAIISIEEQIERAGVAGTLLSDHMIRAKTALKHRRRARPVLQERIGQFRRAQKAAAQPPAVTLPCDLAARRRTLWRRAFVAAVREILPEEQFLAISAKADAIADAEIGGAA